MRLLNNAYVFQPKAIKQKQSKFTAHPLRLTIILFLMIISWMVGQAQDCLHDTIPPVIVCKQNYIYQFSSCGNTIVLASEFVSSAHDDCSLVSITFDSAGTQRWVEEIVLLENNPNLSLGKIRIYGRDSSGNVTDCTATFIPAFAPVTKTIACNLVSEFYDENDKIQLQIRTNTNAIYTASLLKYNQTTLNFMVTIALNESIQSIIVDALNKPFTQNHIHLSDLFEMLRYIIGMPLYDSPLNKICEDADCNGAVDLMDVYHSNQYLLGNLSSDSCIGKALVCFVDEKGYILGHEIPYNGSSTKYPIIAFNQIGDVNRNLPVLATTNADSITKFAGEPLIWKATEINCLQGNQYSVDFILTDSIFLFGLQSNFSFDSNRIQLLDFKTNFSALINILPDDIRFDWMNTSNPQFENDYPKATITFIAKSDFALHEAFNPIKQSINNFAILSNGSVKPIHAEFNSINATNQTDNKKPQIKIISSASNSTITLYGKVAPFLDADLTIYNIYGQSVYNKKISGQDGQIKETFQLSQSGIYFMIIQMTKGSPIIQSFEVVH